MTRFDFSSKHITNQTTTRLDLNEIEGVWDEEKQEHLDPFLTVKPATQANKSYFNAVLKQAPKFARGMRKKKVDPKTLDLARDDDRELYPKFVFAGWGNIPDANGNVAEYNPENAAAFCRALPDWIFDRIRAFCGVDDNFVDDDAPSPNELEEQQGN